VQLPLPMEEMVLPLKKRTAAPREAADFTITFDGGALGNPGKGYGSYHIVGPNGYEARERLDYGDRVTNNQAEYRTLIAALSRLQREHAALQRRGHVAIRGDSQLVVNQVNGEWKVKHPDLAPLHRQAVALLQAFHSVDVGWHRRHESVRILVH
jgi:ribonuclease HI